MIENKVIEFDCQRYCVLARLCCCDRIRTMSKQNVFHKSTGITIFFVNYDQVPAQYWSTVTGHAGDVLGAGLGCGPVWLRTGESRPGVPFPRGSVVNGLARVYLTNRNAETLCLGSAVKRASAA